MWRELYFRALLTNGGIDEQTACFVVGQISHAVGGACPDRFEHNQDTRLAVLLASFCFCQAKRNAFDDRKGTQFVS